MDSPRLKCLGCWFTWSLWLLLYRAVASVTFRLRAASAAAPVHHTLRQPGFPRKLRLRGCQRWLRLRILSRRSPLGRSLCSVSFFGLVSFYPSGWLERQLGSLPLIFPFSFSFGVLVTPGMLEWELEGAFPSGCSSFSFGGCPASALAVAGIGGRVLRAHPFFGTVDWCLFRTLLFPSYATRCRYDVPGVLASGSGLAASA